MEKNPSNSDGLYEGLRHSVGSFLNEIDGIISDDREIILPPDMARELDVSEIIIRRREGLERTVCSVHHPPNETAYWRHTTYVFWDDGRTAEFDNNYVPDEYERETLQRPTKASQKLKEIVTQLVQDNVITKSYARQRLSMYGDEAERLIEALTDNTMLSDDEGESISLADALGIVAEWSKRVDEDIPELKTSIYEMYVACAMVQLLRNRLVERHLLLHDQALARAASNEASPIEPVHAWELLELLDKVQQI